MLTASTQAPNFTLPDKDGRQVSLSDYLGKKVVLYFYPKDNTSGCTKQAEQFAALYPQFKALNCEVIGISKDSVASHQKFADKLSLPFTILSDVERSAIEAYGVWQAKNMYGKLTMGVVRSTFVINEEGTLVSCAYKVNSAKNAMDTLEIVKDIA